MAEGETRQRLLNELLAAEDVACPNCSYNLRGLTGDRCPECNQRLALRVNLAEPNLGAFLTGLIGIGMGFGFCALLLVWVGVMLLVRTGRGGPSWDVIAPLFPGLIVNLVLLVVWVAVRRRWFAKQEPRRRWTIALIAVVLAMLGPLFFMLTAR
ncbi:MAG: hypothetical protein K2W85_03705 [Phycisphaerales bacterium]|nr:hypothetical protein [Phycisphaerales bacterium]